MVQFRQIILCSLLAGLTTGLIHTGIQQISTVPYILQAESFELLLTDQQAHSHNSEYQRSNSDWHRVAATGLANMSIAIGFALVLTALCSWQKHFSFWRGFLWGLAGFVVFFLAPAWINTPGLPGAQMSMLQDRQWDWFVAVIVSTSGLVCLLLLNRRRWRFIGVLLLILFVVFAPRHTTYYELPALTELAQSFFWASLMSNAVFWLLLGIGVNLILPKLARV